MQGIESKEVAEKVDQIIRSKAKESDIAVILAKLDKINHRLDKLESLSNPQSEITNSESIHPSQERFEIAEAIADAIFASPTNEKACAFEPNAKPCDHCSMCSSRGF